MNRRIALSLLAACLAVAVAVPAAAATDEAGPLFPIETEGIQAMIDEYVSAAEGLAEHLDDAGVAYEVREVPVVLWDFEDPSAAEAVRDYLEELDLPMTAWLDAFSFDGPFGDGFPFEGDWEPMLPEGVVDELNGRADELAAFLEDRGIDCELEEGPGGVRFVIPDLSDPDVGDALEEYWAEYGGPISEIFDFGWGDASGFHLHGPRWSLEFHGPGGPGLLRELFGRE